MKAVYLVTALAASAGLILALLMAACPPRRRYHLVGDHARFTTYHIRTDEHFGQWVYSLDDILYPIDKDQATRYTAEEVIDQFFLHQVNLAHPWIKNIRIERAS